MPEKTREIWLKAAAAGSLWASIEILVGSFLHNLRIPFAGTILAVMGISLMIGYQYKWKDKGLIWRAGLICAIMKSLSPSAVILGPMLGILTEAFLLEITVRWLGRNPLGFIVGSILAVFSALVHKVVTLLILYGFNIVDILENMYRFAEKQLKFQGPEPKQLLMILVLVYVFFGVLASIFGMLAGHQLNKIRQKPVQFISMKSFKGIDFPDKVRYSVILLGFNLLVLVILLYLINNVGFLIALIFVLPYILFVFIRYRSALRRLSKPLFWIQLLIILGISILFWNEYTTGVLFHMDGFLGGLKMILRALLVVMVFSSLSVEMRNPIIRTILYKRGFAQLYASLSLAFSALPGIIEKTSNPRTFIVKPVQTLAGVIENTDEIINAFHQSLKKSLPVFMIAGNQREGKTRFLQQTIKIVLEHTSNVYGIVALGIDDSGDRVGFKVVDIRTNKIKTLCLKDYHKNWIRTGKYFFDPDSIQFGKEVIAKIPGEALAVIDEVGPLELSSEGWDHSLNQLIANHQAPLLLVVRRNLIQEIISRYQIHNAIIMDISKYKPQELAEAIVGEMGRIMDDNN